jgi:type IV pilus assembly protein PilY1
MATAESRVQERIMRINARRITWTTLSLAFSLLAGTPAWTDDTELFLTVPGANDNRFNANILLIIDSSGSMSSTQLTNTPYSSATVYGGACDATRLYWSELGQVPICDSANVRFIDESSFQCFAARRLLDGIGWYSGVLAQNRDTHTETYPDGDGVFAWQTLEPGNATDSTDCAEDGEKGALSSAVNEPIVGWGSYPASQNYYVYDGNYLNWKANPVPMEMSRLDIVKSSLKTALSSISSSNIGIMRYNEFDGGTVIQAMTDLDSNRAAIDAVINAIVADGHTPISETLYEAALYWMGLPAHYGAEIGQHTTDPDALRSNTPAIYQAVDSPACTRNYNVLLTDGTPREDLDTPALAPTLPDFAARLGRRACNGTGTGGTILEGDCLDDITEYLSIPDYDPEQKGDQSVTTHAIGFTTDLPILRDAAEVSGGDYYLADDVENLTHALLRIFDIANNQSLSFSSPAVAVSAFNRAQNRNDLYMAVFEAKARTHWPGNLKKYRISGGKIVDANGNDAVDPLTGSFADTALSFWTDTGPDGNDVKSGGAAHELPLPAARKLFTNNGVDSALTGVSNELSVPNASAYSPADFGLTGAAGEPTVEEIIRWARGEDLLDEDGNPETTVRYAIGDPLHSQPAALDYGSADGHSDLVVFMATNDGILHAIDGEAGAELWSFVPRELLDRFGELYFNLDSRYKSYGIDGDVVPIVVDRNNNGLIDGTDFVRIVFGLRRGGNSYYALDVTDPNSPELLWQTNVAFPGQSWSRPSIARVDIDDPGLNADKAMVILGGGYDSRHDIALYPATPDTAGVGIHMLDLETGTEIWRAGPDPGADLRLRNMTRSFPSALRVVDLDGNGVADRIYAADVGGQLWRFDLFPGQVPANAVTGGVIARVGAEGIDSPTKSETRRVYNSPDVALFTDPIDSRRYISVSVGTGYRAHPLNTDATDRFYSFRDADAFNSLSQADFDGYVIAADADFVEVSGATQTVIGTKDRGWKFTLPATQMVLADSFTFADDILFVAFSPEALATDTCTTRYGRNFLYRVSVVNGDPIVPDLDVLIDPDAERVENLKQGGIAPMPSFLFPSPDEPNCEGQACNPRPIGCVGVECFDPGFENRPVRTLWTQDGVE